ncbi:MAG: hypothetical protein KC493_00690 [Bacteriovoracaceae bacterium]|nr:hypothetical protein [Bacteriovoracaceae bacterium]
MSEERKYCKIPPALLEKYGKKFPFDVFLKIGPTKIIKISHGDEDITETYKRYRAKGVEDVYALEEEFKSFMNFMRKTIQNKFFDESTIDGKVVVLDSCYAVAKEAFQKIGVSSESISLAQDIAKKSMEVLQEQPNIFKFFEKFKENCSEEYMYNVTLTFTISSMMEFVDWSSASIKEKSIMAVMLRDIILLPEHFEEIKNWDGDKKNLSKMALNHPILVAEMLQEDNNNWVSPEVIQIIEQHHERPQGIGFPLGTKHMQISQLSAIHIVADVFTHKLIDCEFNFKEKEKIISDIQGQFYVGTFRKAVDALNDMFGG